MIGLLPFLANEKVTSDTITEGFDFDLSAASDLLKTLSEYNPSVWNYISAVTRQVTFPIAVSILSVLIILEISNIAKKVSSTDGNMTLEFFAPLILKLILITIFMPNSLKVVEGLIEVGGKMLSGIAGIVAKGGMNYDTLSGFSGKGLGGKMILAVVYLIVFLARSVSFIIVNLIVTMRFMQLYLMAPFAPLAISTLVHEEWRSIGIGYFKNIIVYVVQGVLIYLTMSFTGLFVNHSAQQTGGAFFAAFFGAITQAILLIIVLVGTQRTARNILGM